MSIVEKLEIMRRRFRLLLLLVPAVLFWWAFAFKTAYKASGAPRVAANLKSIPPPFYTDAAEKWADSVMKKMTVDQRIGQLFMVAAWSNKDQKHVNEIKKLVSHHHIGGLIFMQGGPVRQAKLTNTYQSLAKVPLLIGMDAEWGMSMRLDSLPIFPRQMTMGAAQNDSLVYAMGREAARQCKRLGVHVSFSPACDVNNNPNNPVIGTRSFGEDRELVATKSIMYMKGLQQEGILACGKHFPGHGDTDSDSHKTLPVINHPVRRLDSLELYPFKRLISEGLGSVMVAHLQIPAYDTTNNQATTLSRFVVDTLLQQQLGFRGLIFTDALNMKGVSAYYKEGDVEVRALMAGNDVLLFSGNVPLAIQKIKTAIQQQQITQQQVDARCKKILQAKYWSGVHKNKKVKLEGLYRDLNTSESERINELFGKQSITLLKNNDELLPILDFKKHRLAVIQLGGGKQESFTQRLSWYMPFRHEILPYNAGGALIDSVLSRVDENGTILLLCTTVSQRVANNYGITDLPERMIDSLLKRKHRVALLVMGNVYSINTIKNADLCHAVVAGMEDQPYMQDGAAQIVAGAVGASGKLPVSLNKWESGVGLRTGGKYRVEYTCYQNIGLSEKSIIKIDSIIQDAIKEKAFPGCQLYAAKDGKVFLHRSYGKFTYDGSRKVSNTDLYDIASVTKIVATAPAMMRMYDQGKFKLEDTLGKILPELKQTNKSALRVDDIMAHRAGLPAWIPFWMKTVDKQGNLKREVYRKQWNDSFPIYVAPGIFISIDYKDSIYSQINTITVATDHKYVYSDLGFYYWKKFIEHETRKLLSEHVMETFYSPLGLRSIGFQPRLRFSPQICAPAERDEKFRKQLLQGDVHDQGAAMLGGIGGHAGVFSNANDVGVMMQLFLNYGRYGGQRFIDSSTIVEFTKYRVDDPENRRGLLFDKRDKQKDKPQASGQYASPSSYGHQGFTGTQAWADPETGIVVVFLSNRVYPSADDNKLAKMGIRGKLTDAIYEGLGYVKPTAAK
jgi:beta-glucosidase-like glycosyl hydrolase/CubicO group peptidase (beta-lactamase class C family)